ncbi:hypothetical protein [Stieleria marina]
MSSYGHLGQQSVLVAVVPSVKEQLQQVQAGKQEQLASEQL